MQLQETNTQHFDLYASLKTDPEFANKMLEAADNLARREAAYDLGRSSSAPVAAAITEVLRLCDYNAALLTPHYFPRYPYDKPLSLLSRPFMVEMMKFQIGGYSVFRAGRQIGKSTGICDFQLTYTDLIPKYRTMYVCPHHEHKKTYANRLDEMYRAFRYRESVSGLRKNLYYKEFSNGSLIEIVNALTTADPTRGKTVDSLVYDEVQSMDINLEPEIQQTQKSSEMPSTIYAGTSLTLDTMLETKYLDSSQATWHIPSPDGKHWLDTGDRETVIKMIRPHGLTCPFTGRVVDPREGHYVHAYPSRAAAGLTGLHIPQIIIPEYAVDPLKWDEIYQSFLDYGELKFLQEVIGIPVEEADRELSKSDLQACCVLEHTQQTSVSRARSGAYKFVVGGCDWGGSDYNQAAKTKQSYTVHNILGMRHDGVFENLYYRRFSGMKYREIIDEIANAHAAYGCYAIASDFGVGAVYNMLLREHPKINPMRHIIFGYTAQHAVVSRPPKSDLYNHLSLNRTETISTLIQWIKSEAPRILFRKWEVDEKFLTDFLNIYRVVQESEQSGAKTFRYRRHGSRPDDAFHATNFAVVLGRLIAGEPLVTDPALLRDIREAFSGFRSRAHGSRAAVVSG